MDAQTIIVAAAQIAPVWLDRKKTLEKVCAQIRAAGRADLVGFGEVIVPGYPFWLDATGGAKFNDPMQKEIFAHYAANAVCIEDGDLSDVQAACRDAATACYLGIAERPRGRTGHTLYCSYVFIAKDGEIGSVHRKLMPTYEERLVWGTGDGNGLVTHRVGPFIAGGLNCWENWMPLARTALYAQGEDLHIAGWPGSRRNTHDITPFIAREGRSYVMSVSGLMRREDIVNTMPYAKEIQAALPPMPADGGSCLAAPDGQWVLEPECGQESLRFATINHEIVRRERQLFDPMGHYSRPDILSLQHDTRRQSGYDRT